MIVSPRKEKLITGQMTKQKNLLKVLNDLKILYTDINRLITEYETIEWKSTASATWLYEGELTGLVHYQQQIYVCKWDPYEILIYNKMGKIIQNKPLNSLCGMDIDETKKKNLYIAGSERVLIFNFTFEKTFDWKLPTTVPGHYFRALKVNENILYLTIECCNRIFLCNISDGKVLKKWGTFKQGFNQGEFCNPKGITVINECVYICDSSNHRIQILMKKNGNFDYQIGNGKEGKSMGKFYLPQTIYYHVEEDIIYIGDGYSVQLFTTENLCIQRLGSKFWKVSGMCRIDDQLYVSDAKQRIQIFSSIS